MLESALAWALVLGALTGLAARPTAAQPGTRVTAARHALVAATEERLWTARIEQSETLLSYRDRNGQPVWAEPLKTRIVSLTAAGQQVYAFQADGSFYRYADDWMPAIDLPGRRRPVDMVALEGVPYALLAGEVAADLPAYDVATSAPASRPFGATAAPLALIRYDQLGWSAVAPAPV